MRRRLKPRRRIWVVAGVVAAAGLLAAGYAFGAAPIVGQADNTYSATSYTIDQGEVAQLQVTGSMHNVIAQANGPDGQPQFHSATISGGTTPADGTQYLTAGDYTFFCSIHPSTMRATLHVTSNGTPQARPHVDLKIASTKLSKVKRGSLQVQVTASTTVTGVSLEARLGPNRILGRASGLTLAAGPQSESIKLTKRGKSELRSKDKARISVDATVPFGQPASTQAKLK
jgi:plastocyanin